MDVSGAVSPDLHGRVALIRLPGTERLRRGNGRGQPFDAAAERVWGNGRVGGNHEVGSGSGRGHPFDAAAERVGVTAVWQAIRRPAPATAVKLNLPGSQVWQAQKDSSLSTRGQTD
jgi:hypothetical protein